MKLSSLIKIFAIFVGILAGLAALRLFVLPADFHGAPGRRFFADSSAAETKAQPLSRFESNLFQVLAELEAEDEEIETRFFLEDTLREIDASIPRGRPLEWVIWHIAQSTKGTSYRVTDCVLDRPSGVCKVTFSSSKDNAPLTVLTITRAQRYFSAVAKMAILLEGFKFKADQGTMDILSFPEPLTLALMPDHEKSGWTAQAAMEYNKQIVIGVPLESHSVPASRAPTPLIMVHHPEEKIRGTLGRFAKIIPRFSGFCNVLGSRACEDSRVMEIVLGEVKKRHGYFVDTRKARSSLVEDLAREMGVPHAYVNSSIDDDIDSAQIQEQLRHHCLVAQKRGTLLISAPATREFISALSGLREVFRRNGVHLVHVSEIVDQPTKK
ncbi:MAG: hypothetical protein GF344_05430 [Chitinivibrionales bacterium]|nr:hypothetical protein [Chitinivibrionales bacterium]MBD3356418.1 hypothetical protein [Chitinivibrionales bacterium]